MSKSDFKSYRDFLSTRQYSKFKADQMLENEFDAVDPHGLDDEEEPVSDWIKELMMDDEEWMEMRQNRDIADLKKKEESDN